MKKQAFLLSLISVSMLLVGCTGNPGNSNGPSSVSNKIEEVEFDTPEGEQPENDFHTPLQWEYLSNEDWTSIKNQIPTTGASGKNLGNFSEPRALELKFDNVEDADTYYFQISSESTFRGAETIELDEKKYDLWNAEVGGTYYYRAALSEEELEDAKIWKYTVNDMAPRNMKVDGILNFRDIGGWKSSLIPNGVVRQGLYYRCGQFNNITAEGKQQIKDLNIRVDIDMRDSGIVNNLKGVSPISDEDYEVELVKASIASGTERQRWSGFSDVYKLIFDKIADAEENPIALHCAQGADRTGIVCFFLLGVLGVSKEDLGREYMFTRFAGERDVWHEVEFDGWVKNTEDTYPDEPTFAEQMKAHLMSKGIEEETIETIREMFVPGYEKYQEVYIPD